MALLLLEGCDIDFQRWTKTGSLTYSKTDGLYNQGAFVIPSSSQKFVNKISNKFNEDNIAVGQRKFRLSFWMTTKGTLSQNVEFITLQSSIENMGGSIGLNTEGRFYVGYLTDESQWKGIWAECGESQPSVLDGKTHFIEFDIHWDTWTGSPVNIWVDGVKYCNKIGRNVPSEEKVWSRPDTITIGNLIGCDLILDDIILWNDVGNYVGQQGPKKVQFSIPKDFHKYADKSVFTGEKLFETSVSPHTRAGIVTMILSHETGKVSLVRPVVKVGNEYMRGENILLMTDAEKTLKMHLDNVNMNNIWIGVEKDADR